MRPAERACLIALLLIAATGFLHSGNSRQIRPPVKPIKDHEVWLQRSPTGDILRMRLAAAPFPDPRRTGGYSFDDVTYPADPHYVDSSVAVLIPTGFHSNGPVNLVFFFHGWNSSIDDVQSRFDLFRQFSQSRVQALLVLPELAWNAPDSYGGKLEREGGFARMVDELLDVLHTEGQIQAARVDSIILAGHSGAYRVIAQILRHGGCASKIGGVWLFDALYDLTDQYDAWIEHSTGRFVSVSASDGEETTDVNELIATLRDERVPLQIARDDPTRDWALRSRVLFLRSDSDHYGVVFDRDEFRRLLESSPVLVPAHRGARTPSADFFGHFLSPPSWRLMS
ncbi:MAG TPA: hypothetical protein VL354_21370 [Spirochaetia bacterium]|nr:hypothetical protein [Spirochaetia bacterium]